MTKINDAVIQESDIFIYNLGTVFVIDRVLFSSQERIGEVLSKHSHKIPSFGGSSVNAPAPDPEHSTVVIDLVAELMAGNLKNSSVVS